MQVLKPQALGLSSRPIEFRRRFGLCVSACLYLPFAQGGRGTLWAEQSMWNFLGKEMAQPLIDEGVAKMTPEFLLHGRAYPRPGQPDACAVRARFAGREKTLLVFGPRYWDGDRASAPQAFESLPLDWSAAYGGPDFAANPQGLGREAKDGVRWLPRTELPHDRLLRPDQAITPAGFGALDLMHPRRAQYRGTYDENYLREHSPGFAPDIDWRTFNLAPADQWLDAPLAGDEVFAFENMHPEQQLVEGRLPGLRARVFADFRKKGETEPHLREVTLRLTTLWFFPHAERCIAIFHGMANIRTDDGADVFGLLGAVERNGEVKPDAHYLDALAKRADPRLGAVYAMVDSDLLPEGVSTDDPEVEAAKAPFAMEGLQAEAQYRHAEVDVMLAREKAVEMGQDPDKLGIRMSPREKVPTGDALPAYLEQKLKEAEKQKWAAIEDMLTVAERALEFSQQHKVDLAQLQHRGPPKYSAETHWAQLQAQAAASKKPMNLEGVYPKLLQLEDAERMGYLQGAHAQPPAPPMQAAEAAALRDEMARAIPLGIKFFPTLDFTGADFSGLDLRGVNFAGAWLESVDFSGANLSGANLSGAVLAHANLRKVVAIGANFSRANLGRAALAQGVFDESDFSAAMLMHCDFAHTQMRKARFAGAQLLESRWGEADWSGAQLAGQVFNEADLQGLCLSEADLSSCNFVKCNLSGVDMRGAQLGYANFVTCSLDKALMAGAHGAGLCMVMGSHGETVDLSRANLSGANLGECSLRGAKLMHAVLDGANLREADLENADLRLASAKGALLTSARFMGARLAGANLRDAILQKADLRGVDLRRCNLFGADLSRVLVDQATTLEGALMKRARTWPRHRPQEHQEAAA